VSGADGGRARAASPLPYPGRRLVLTFEAFHDTYHRAWLRFAHLQVGDRAAAEAIVQDLCTQLACDWTHVLKQGSVQSYAWALLKEHVAFWLYEHNRQVALVETAAFAAAITRMLRLTRERFAILEGEIGLYAAIARLPERQYDVIVLRYVLGYPDSEVGALLGVKEPTVRSHVRFAKRRLSAELGLAWQREEGDQA
jgi:RNA polymerase sigma factor (sigma-70 family)